MIGIIYKIIAKEIDICILVLYVDDLLIRGYLGSLLGLLGIREYSIWANERGASVTVLFIFFFSREAIT